MQIKTNRIGSTERLVVFVLFEDNTCSIHTVLGVVEVVSRVLTGKYRI